MAYYIFGLKFGKEDRALVSMENPQVTLSEFIDATTLGRSAADISVTDSNALAVSAVYSCIKVISETIAELPLDLFKRTTKGKERVYGDLDYLLSTSPGVYTSYTFRQALQTCALLYGNGYAYIERNGGMKPTSLILLDPKKVEVKTADGEVLYEIRDAEMTMPNGMRTNILEPWQLIHIKGFSLDGIVGISPLEYHKESIANGLALQEFSNKFFGQGTLASGIVTTAGQLDEKGLKSLRAQWKKYYQGRKHAHTPLILDAGMDYKQISINPDQAQFIASRNYNVEDIARIYRVPQHMIQKLDRSTNNNIEQQSLEFLQYCMLPWIKNWEQELDRKFLKRGDNQFFKFNLNALMRGDLQTRSEYYVKAINNGWLSPNEIRELENMNPREGGDIYLIPMNLTTNADGKEDI